MTDINYMNDLKVEVQVPTPGLQNLIKNPSGEQGGWGWETPVSNTIIKGERGSWDNFNYNLAFVNSVSQASYFSTEMMPMTAGQYAVARYNITAISAGHNLKVKFGFYNSSKVFLSFSTYTAAQSAVQTHYVPAALAPANTAYVKVFFDLYNGVGNAAANAYVYIRDVMVAKSASSTGFGSIRENLFLDPNSTSPATWSSAVSWMPITTSTVAWGYTGGQSTQLRGPDTSDGNATTYAASSSFNVIAGEYYTSSAYVRGTGYTRDVYLAIQWYVGGAWQNVWYAAAPVTLPSDGTWVRPNVIMRAPTGATAARLIIHGKTFINGEYIYVDGVLVEQTNYLKSYFDGSMTAGGGVTYAWSGTVNNSKSTATVASASFDYQPPYAWLPITGSVNELTIDRETMNVGLLSVRIKDKELDPAGRYNAVLAPGKQVRVQANDAGTWKNLYVGKIKNAHVDYDREKKVNAPIDTTITISAVDAMTDLANQGESRSVADVDELPYILEGKGVPWNVNGVTSHIATTPVIPVVNENLSVADQVVITRDTQLGHAWVSKDGVLNVIDSAYKPWDDYSHYFADYTLPAQTNQMVNSGFESADVSKWVKPSWVDATVVRSASAAKNGGYGLRATTTTATSGIELFYNYDGGSYSNIPVDGPGLYKVGYWIRPSGNCWLTDGFTYNEYQLFANQWSYIEVTTARNWQDTTAPFLGAANQWYIDTWGYANIAVYADDYADLPLGFTVDVDDYTVTKVSPDAFYSGIDIDWDTERIVNQVIVKKLITNAEGNAEEVVYGPYEQSTSVKNYGAFKKEYTIVGSMNPQTFATSILNGNSGPSIRVNALRMPVKDAASLSKAIALELCDGARVYFGDKLDEWDIQRITTIKHNIGPDGWFVDITFDTSDSNAVPQYTPAPPVDSNNLTNTGWIQPALANNWGYYGGTGSNWGPLAYRRVNGIVYMRGLITKTVGSTAEGVFQLPVGFRPAYHHMVPMVNNSPDYARMDVQSDGWVVFPGGVPNVAFVSVNTCWVADQ